MRFKIKPKVKERVFENIKKINEIKRDYHNHVEKFKDLAHLKKIITSFVDFKISLKILLFLFHLQ
jgi:hypothetical protein